MERNGDKMNIDELKSKFKDYYKWNDTEYEVYSKQIDSLSVKTNGENERIIAALVLYNDTAKKPSPNGFFKEALKYINRIKQTESRSSYINKDVGYIVESLLDSMEYNLQKKVGNEAITSRQNRSNYKRIMTAKYNHDDLNKKLNSFVISLNGTIEIIPEKRELFIDQVQQIIEMADIEIIKVYLINYFWDFGKWTENILVPLTVNLENDIIIQTKNDSARSRQAMSEEMEKVIKKAGIK